jgi:hypothetical protein
VAGVLQIFFMLVPLVQFLAVLEQRTNYRRTKQSRTRHVSKLSPSLCAFFIAAGGDTVLRAASSPEQADKV